MVRWVKLVAFMAIVTIGGNIGSGKTTIVPRLVLALGYDDIYMGKIFRDLADERGMTLEAFYQSLASDPEVERAVDAKQIAIMKERDNIIIQGRISFFFAKQIVKQVINIFIGVDPKVGAQRKLKEGIHPGKTLEEILALNLAREEAERQHYLALYGINNHLDPSIFDIACDTTNLSVEEASEILLQKIREKLQS